MLVQVAWPGSGWLSGLLSRRRVETEWVELAVSRKDAGPLTVTVHDSGIVVHKDGVSYCLDFRDMVTQAKPVS